MSHIFEGPSSHHPTLGDLLADIEQMTRQAEELVHDGSAARARRYASAAMQAWSELAPVLSAYAPQSRLPQRIRALMEASPTPSSPMDVTAAPRRAGSSERSFWHRPAMRSAAGRAPSCTI